jgi:hypothetical protein
VLLMSAVHKLNLRGCDEDGFIRKPFDIRAVQQSVKRLLSELA